MTASTAIRHLLTGFLALGLTYSSALASSPRVGIAPFVHEVPNIREGLAELLSQQLNGNGRMRLVASSEVAAVLSDGAALQQAFERGPNEEQLTALAQKMDYLLLGRVESFGLAAKDKPSDHSRDLNDWGRGVFGDNEVAQTWLELRLIDLRSGERVLSSSVEGLESRKGTRLRHISYGWLGTIDLTSDSFRRTTLGRSTYKAVGAFLFELYPHFPLSGKVLAVAGDSVVLDLDARSGVKVGDDVAILSTLQVQDSSGVVQYSSEQRVGGARVVELQHGRCLCLLLDGAGRIKEGDVARPLEERWVVPEETEKRD